MPREAHTFFCKKKQCYLKLKHVWVYFIFINFSYWINFNVFILLAKSNLTSLLIYLSRPYHKLHQSRNQIHYFNVPWAWSHLAHICAGALLCVEYWHDCAHWIDRCFTLCSGHMVSITHIPFYRELYLYWYQSHNAYWYLARYAHWLVPGAHNSKHPGHVLAMSCLKLFPISLLHLSKSSLFHYCHVLKYSLFHFRLMWHVPYFISSLSYVEEFLISPLSCVTCSLFQHCLVLKYSLFHPCLVLKYSLFLPRLVWHVPFFIIVLCWSVPHFSLDLWDMFLISLLSSVEVFLISSLSCVEVFLISP